MHYWKFIQSICDIKRPFKVKMRNKEKVSQDQYKEGNVYICKVTTGSFVAFQLLHIMKFLNNMEHDSFSAIAVDFLAAAKYSDPPNFFPPPKIHRKNYVRRKRCQICKIRRGASKTQANLRLSLPFYQAQNCILCLLITSEKSGFICAMLVFSGNHGLDMLTVWYKRYGTEVIYKGNSGN